MNELFIALVFVPLLLILWFANLADRRRPLAAAPGAAEWAGPGEGRGRPDDLQGGALADERPQLVASEGTVPSGEWRPRAESEGGFASAAETGLPVSPARPLSSPPTAAAGGEGGVVFAAIAYALLILLYLALLGFGLIVELIGGLARGPNAAQLAETWSQAGFDGAALVRSFAGIAPGVGPAVWIPALLGILLLLRPVRRLIGRLIPIDPTRTVHAVALSFTMLIVINLLITSLSMSELTAALQQQAQSGGPAVSIASLWFQNLFFLLAGIVGVGWLARRGLPAVLQRLGLRIPTFRQVLLGLGVGLGMMVVIVVVQLVTAALNVAQNTEVEKLTEILIGPLTQSLWGVFTIGVAAALGEETIFRGALQPRFGLVATSILFALTHSQYGFSLSTVVVLILAFVLGIIRDRANTSTAMIVHATFNCAQGLLAFLSIVK